MQSYNYAAWVRSDRIVAGRKSDILEYAGSSRFLVVTGSNICTNKTPHTLALSELQLDMGVRLPLADPNEISRDFDRHDPDVDYAVRLSLRDEKGELKFTTALIACNQDVRVGFLPFTRANVIQQAFKFLGERYSWGHSYNARDCTGLVSEVYKTVGIYLPRNSEQQDQSLIGKNIHFSSVDTTEDKLRVLDAADAGDLVYSTGHVMMFLGIVEGQPYVIHDSSGASWKDEDGNHQQGSLNGVSVAPLTPIQQSSESTAFENIYAIKMIK